MSEKPKILGDAELTWDHDKFIKLMADWFRAAGIDTQSKKTAPITATAMVVQVLNEMHKAGYRIAKMESTETMAQVKIESLRNVFNLLRYKYDESPDMDFMRAASAAIDKVESNPTTVTVRDIKALRFMCNRVEHVHKLRLSDKQHGVSLHLAIEKIQELKP